MVGAAASEFQSFALRVPWRMSQTPDIEKSLPCQKVHLLGKKKALAYGSFRAFLSRLHIFGVASHEGSATQYKSADLIITTSCILTFHTTKCMELK